jgi:hypothetical protein
MEQLPRQRTRKGTIKTTNQKGKEEQKLSSLSRPSNQQSLPITSSQKNRGENNYSKLNPFLNSQSDSDESNIDEKEKNLSSSSITTGQQSSPIKRLRSNRRKFKYSGLNPWYQSDSDESNTESFSPRKNILNKDLHINPSIGVNKVVQKYNNLESFENPSMISKRKSSFLSKSNTEGNNTSINLSFQGNPKVPKTKNSLKTVGSTFNFSNFKLNVIKNSIKSGINIGSKSSIIINIKDIIGKLEKKPLKFTIDSIFYFKSLINIIPEIIELKTQKYTNICMFYINQFEDYPNKYLVYIYYNYKDLYFIYDINENKNIAGKIKTKIYDIGELEPFEIENLLNKNIKILRAINYQINNHSQQQQTIW